MCVSGCAGGAVPCACVCVGKPGCGPGRVCV